MDKATGTGKTRASFKMKSLGRFSDQNPQVRLDLPVLVSVSVSRASDEPDDGVLFIVVVQRQKWKPAAPGEGAD